MINEFERKVIIVAMIAAAIFCVFIIALNFVRHIKRKYPNVAFVTWIRRKLYPCGYCIINKNGTIDCCSNGKGAISMMAAFYKWMVTKGVPEDVIWEVLKESVESMPVRSVWSEGE